MLTLLTLTIHRTSSLRSSFSHLRAEVPLKVPIRVVLVLLVLMKSPSLLRFVVAAVSVAVVPDYSDAVFGGFVVFHVGRDSYEERRVNL